MLLDKNWLRKFIQQLPKKTHLRSLFDELVYGKQGYRMAQDKKIKPITLYLHESNPEILIIILQGQRQQWFDFRNSTFENKNFKYELDFNMSKHEYLILKDNQSEIILIFPHQQDKKNMLQLFNFYKSKLKNMPLQIDSLLFTTFSKSDLNKNMTLCKEQINNLLQTIKYGQLQTFNILRDFVHQDDQQQNQITFRQFQKIMKFLQCRLQFKDLFQRISQTQLTSFHYYLRPLLDKEKFIKFLNKQQGQPIQNCQKIVKQIMQNKKHLSFYQFGKYLIDTNNSIASNDKNHLQSQQNSPLIDYFCYSSHNTYLTGNQLTSQSKTERYQQDLYNGYRCLQIDIHDGKQQPIVKHGFTMTTQVTFRHVIETISNYSENNPHHTPIILSLQNHTNYNQQSIVAKILKQYFKNKIVKIQDYLDYKEYPSLKQLRGKILIKSAGNISTYQLLINKQQSEFILQHVQNEDEQQLNQITLNISSQHLDSDHLIFSKEYYEQFMQLKKDLKNKKRQFLKIQNIIKNNISQNFSIKSNTKTKTISKLNPQLLQITCMLAKGDLNRKNKWESISMSQDKILKYFDHKPTVLSQHTKYSWIRAYPAATRFDSSNYDPLPALELGVQIIAINSQYMDFNCLILKQLFKSSMLNKHNGYLLKKQYLNAQMPIKIQICPVSAFMISQNKKNKNFPKVNVKMSFNGHTVDKEQNKAYCAHQSYTETVTNNGFNPIFQNSSKMILNIKYPKLAFIQVQIPDCGMGVIYLENIKKGYRVLSLLDDRFCQKNSVIVFKIQ